MACHMTKQTPSKRRALSSLIETVLRLVRAGSRSFAQGKRILPPVSKATGGPMAGVDLSDLSALQETDDLITSHGSRSTATSRGSRA
jgi:hypothetical protein